MATTDGTAPLPAGPAGPMVIANVVGFHAVWFLSLYGAGRGLPWLGAAALVLFLADTLFARAGLLAYAAPWPLPGFAPAWIVVMWVNFALTLNVALRWLQGRAWLAAVLGFVGGPFAYLAGIRLDAATLTAAPPVAYSVIGAVWAVAVPLLVVVAGRAARRWPVAAA